MKHPFRNCTVAIIFSFLLSFTGCQSKEADLQTEKLDSQPEKSNPDTDFSPDFLTNAHWCYFTNCDETISFGADGSYCYYCACGSPVGDSDLYDSYTYDETTSEITLYPKGEEDHIKVLRYENGRLLLEFTDGIKEFFDSDDLQISNAVPCPYVDADQYIGNYSSCTAVSEKDGHIFTTAPSGTDTDSSDFLTYLLQEKLSTDVSFFEWNVLSPESDENNITTQSYEELSFQQVEELLKDIAQTAFVWYNNHAEIEKIVFYNKLPCE